MTTGTDRIVQKEFSPNTFLLSKEMQKLRSTYANPKQQLPKIGGLKSLENLTQTALWQMLEGSRSADIDYHFGPGSSKWLKNNMDKFSPDEWLELYDVFNNLSKRPLVPNNIKSDSPIRVPSNNILGDRG